jgi:NAD(P)H-dependent FMN reductase
MINVKIILISTRPGRKGEAIANWILKEAGNHHNLDVSMIDLKEENLPFMDEPNHPRFGQYTHQHTKDWSAKIAATDAFILVLPEYNHGYPATIKNAIDFLYTEWRHKPVGFVTYGGIAAGTRSMQMLKQVLSALEMFPLTAAVNIPNFPAFIKDDVFTPADEHKKNAAGMLKELEKWGNHLNAVRQVTP